MKKIRDSRFELMRLLAILMVVLSHFSSFGQEHRLQLNPTFFDRIGADLFTPLGKIGVALFILITGFFLGSKKITAQSAIERSWKVWAETFFYTIVLFIVVTIADGKIQLILLIKSLIPVTTNLYWFVTAYIILMLFLPVINVALNQLTKQQFQYIIVINLIINIMIPVLQVNLQLTVILPYLIGAYVGKYGIVLKNKILYLFLEVNPNCWSEFLGY